MIDRRLGGHKTSERDAPRARGRDDSLRARARALNDATPVEVEALDRGGRVADIEARYRAPADLTGEE